MKHITFPGLGIDLTIHPTAFSIGSLSVQWYGILITTGIILAFIYFLNRATKTEGIHADHIYNVTLISVILGVIGARTLYVVTNLSNYDTFWEMINIPGGGLAIYGAIIFGGAGLIIYAKIKDIKPFALFDAVAPAILIGQIIGRWGNFINAEAYGYSPGVEKLPWRMGLDTVRIDGVIHPEISFVHPTFLYESLWNLVGFLVINSLYKKKKFDGQITMYYIAWYGLGRGLIELLRTDSLRVFGLKLMVILGLASFVAVAIALPVILRKVKVRQATAVAYESKYKAESVETVQVLEFDTNKEAIADTADAVPFEYSEEDEELPEQPLQADDEEAVLQEQDSLDE